jgi:DNA polymerase-3 subunit epsilon
MDAAEGTIPGDLPRDLVFVDLETTGGNAAYDRITEVGVVRLSDGAVTEEWSSLVNPERPIPAYIEAFTGISNAMVAGAPRFAEIAALLRQKLQGAVFVAHNARFDYSFLRSEFLKSDMNFTAKLLCTVKLSRRLFPEYVRHNLDAVMERNGLVCTARHRALGDARVLYDFWRKLQREVDDARLAAAVRAVIGTQQLPAHFPPGLADDLPEGAGVYRFFDDNDALLFVGKAKSLRTRVCSHFAAANAAARERALASQVRRIDWLETYGELGATLREAAWLKGQKPLYNRRAKTAEQFYTLRALGASVAAVPIDGVELGNLCECFGTFHSAKDAVKALHDIARAHQLCLKVLGLEGEPGSCVAYQVGKCKGACVGKEPLLLHLMRVQLALTSLKLKAWPFRGAIALREREPRQGNSWGTPAMELHVFDHWVYIGTARTEEELAELRPRAAGGTFSVDVYRLLVRYFAKNPRLECIDLERTLANTIG